MISLRRFLGRYDEQYGAAGKSDREIFLMLRDDFRRQSKMIACTADGGHRGPHLPVLSYQEPTPSSQTCAATDRPLVDCSPSLATAPVRGGKRRPRTSRPPLIRLLIGIARHQI